MNRTPLVLGEAYAGRAAAALEHARLFERVQEARREAERLNAEKARFLSVLSHEIRTPISSCLGYVELMLAGIPEPLPAAHQAYAHGIQASVQHQLELVEQILQFARVHSARADPDPRDVNVVELLRGVTEMIRPAAEQAGIEVELGGAADAVVIRTDTGMLRQALLNIANNAVRFTERGRVRLTADRAGDTIVLCIEDTGPGIPPVDLDRIFDTFWRGEGSAGRWPAGMGLGLAITRELVEKLGGTISVESEVGRRTEFRIRLPVRFDAGRNLADAESAPHGPVVTTSES